MAVALVGGMCLVSCSKNTDPDPAASGGGLASGMVGSNPDVPIAGQYIVVLNTPVAGATFELRLAAVNTVATGLLGGLGLGTLPVVATFSDALTGFVVKNVSAAQLLLLQNDPRVKYVHQDGLFLFSPLLSSPPPPSQPAQEIPYGITRVGGAGDGTGKTAWVIDTGIDLDHPDLLVDQPRSRSFVPGFGSADDDNGHGSHVAGTIGARNNTIGVVGVAAGCTLVAVKVLNAQGSGSISQVIQGVDYVAATARPGDAANLSLSGSIYQALDDAVVNLAARGVFVAVAAGNASASATGSSPARANGLNLYTVTAMDRNNAFASFSNFGNPPVDWCEPGVDVKSTFMNGAYQTLSGTSMAAPHLAGILLMRGGSVTADGNVTGDRDGIPDRIGRR
ncbi:hypothetical protein GCM10022409_10270 [Hymenobacter glaciei]|uniref:Peptidase S8/S53 domain-containing protein n=1 Tax=Hymenobacter glaciei TaxID=877209 RepID=A0ABP7TLQ5_9BACT